MINKVEICGVNTSKLPVLKNEEMRNLFKVMQAGDTQAREKLIQGNLRLVLSVIQRFNNRGEYVDDLFQVGCIGLIKSIDNFDLTQNTNAILNGQPTSQYGVNYYATPTDFANKVKIANPTSYQNILLPYQVQNIIAEVYNLENSDIKNIASIWQSYLKTNSKEFWLENEVKNYQNFNILDMSVADIFLFLRLNEYSPSLP